MLGEDAKISELVPSLMEMRRAKKNIVVSVLVMQFRPRKLCIYRRVLCIPRFLDGLGRPGVPAAEVSIRLPVLVSESSNRKIGGIPDIHNVIHVVAERDE